MMSEELRHSIRIYRRILPYHLSLYDVCRSITVDHIQLVHIVRADVLKSKTATEVTIGVSLFQRANNKFCKKSELARSDWLLQSGSVCTVR